MTDLTKHNTICIFSTCWTGFSQSLSLSHTFRLFHAPALPCFLSSLALLHSFLTSISLYECGCAGKCLFHPVAAQMRQTDRFTPPPPSSHTLHSTHSIPRMQENIPRMHPHRSFFPSHLSGFGRCLTLTPPPLPYPSAWALFFHSHSVPLVHQDLPHLSVHPNPPLTSPDSLPSCPYASLHHSNYSASLVSPRSLSLLSFPHSCPSFSTSRPPGHKESSPTFSQFSLPHHHPNDLQATPPPFPPLL